MPRHASSDCVVKPQPTLKGYWAWVFAQYVEADAKEAGPVAAQLIEEALRAKQEVLLRDYGITREGFRAATGENVIEHKAVGHPRKVGA
jgi:hypothetical protein